MSKDAKSSSGKMTPPLDEWNQFDQKLSSFKSSKIWSRFGPGDTWVHK
jgi:hypothetical protein